MPRVSFAPPPLCLSAPTLVGRLVPALPATVRDVDTPPVFREPFILSGYRPVGLPRRCYVLGLLQIHNETVNVWSHLLAAVCVGARFLLFVIFQGGGILGFRLQGPEGQGFSVDVCSLPLLLYVCSALTHLSCSAAAHLLRCRSERARCSLFLLECAAAAVHQYGAALALCLYGSDAAWTQSMLGQIFLPVAAFLAWLSCATCCCATLRSRRPGRPYRKLCRLILVGVAFLLDVSPVAGRLSFHGWTSSSPLYVLQVVLFLLAAFFFACPVPECFSRGRYDIIGHSHQLFHILLSFHTLAQQEALFRDFLARRPALVRWLGEGRLSLACASFPCLALCCALTALGTRRQLLKEQPQ